MLARCIVLSDEVLAHQWFRLGTRLGPRLLQKVLNNFASRNCMDALRKLGHPLGQEVIDRLAMAAATDVIAHQDGPGDLLAWSISNSSRILLTWAPSQSAIDQLVPTLFRPHFCGVVMTLLMNRRIPSPEIYESTILGVTNEPFDNFITRTLRFLKPTSAFIDTVFTRAVKHCELEVVKDFKTQISIISQEALDAALWIAARADKKEIVKYLIKSTKRPTDAAIQGVLEAPESDVPRSITKMIRRLKY
jgi:hypothetical protein